MPAVSTHCNASSRYALSTGPAILSIFISGNPASDLSAREGPRDIIKIGFFCSYACFTNRKAEYVAREVPRIKSWEADSSISNLGCQFAIEQALGSTHDVSLVSFVKVSP